MWATESVDDRSEKDSEKVMLLPTICMPNAPEPAVLIGGTSFAPTRLAENFSVAERAAGTAKRLAASVAIANMPIFRVFIDEFYLMGRAVVKLFRSRRAATS